jgi:SAM-dependent methyltransferase
MKQLQELAQRVPALVALIDELTKRTLARSLWLAWRSRLNGFYSRRGGRASAGRIYIDAFLHAHAAECRGRFLEFGDAYYRRMFRPEQIERYDVLGVAPGRGVTIVGDIQQCPQISDNSFDVIVCTQVLEHVPNPFLAVSELHRMLKPGGILLLTVPAAFPYHADPQDYWRFSRDSLKLLFSSTFRDLEIKGCGNRLVVTAAYWFWDANQLPERAIQAHDADTPLLLTLVGKKA